MASKGRMGIQAIQSNKGNKMSVVSMASKGRMGIQEEDGTHCYGDQ